MIWFDLMSLGLIYCFRLDDCWMFEMLGFVRVGLCVDCFGNITEVWVCSLVALSLCVLCDLVFSLG